MVKMFAELQDAINFKTNYEYLIGRILKPELSPLIKLIIINEYPDEFGMLWASQNEAFEEPEISKAVTDEEFERQLKEFDNIDLTPVEGKFYRVIGVFRCENGIPRFQPLDSLLSDNDLLKAPH